MCFFFLVSLNSYDISFSTSSPCFVPVRASSFFHCHRLHNKNISYHCAYWKNISRVPGYR
jgi:hypothetical protein